MPINKQNNSSKAGRKPVEDKKVPFVLYLNESLISKLGKDNIRKICYDAIITTK